MNRPIAYMLIVLLAWPAVPALAGPRGEQDQARRELREGKILSSREIEALILPNMRGWEYVGFEYDPTVTAYRLKFLKQGNVTFIDVDARTGDILRQMR